ncbi:MAG: sulfatase-like hydrolase/transferase [Bacteriovoracaceae bacterium]|nr:sulfatase-like hydrolase/transferase [Bacteriovoracaceae bacterium]
MGEKGSATFRAKAVLPSRTIPGHTSMLTGLHPVEHGMLNNLYTADEQVQDPTLYDVIKKHDPELVTAASFSKFKLKSILTVDDSYDAVDYLMAPNPKVEFFKLLQAPIFEIAKYENSRTVLRNALNIIRDHNPNFLFVHFADVDWAGHWRSGWDKLRQHKNLRRVDGMIGEIVKELEATDPNFENTTIIVTADHGGHGKHHGTEDPEGNEVNIDDPSVLSYDMFSEDNYIIPFVIYGQNYRSGVALPDDTIFGTDTFSYVLEQLDIEKP